MSKIVKSADLDARRDEIADALLNDKLVVVPTETVYGLGAIASSAEAVAKIFNAKGRPASNPLIVHCADIEQATAMTTQWPDVAQLLAERFWPGPLTIVLPVADGVPEIITAGGPTVGVRVPANESFLEILRAVGPIAAPSANLSNQISPTRTVHLAAELLEHVAFVIDDGPCEIGIESTVVRCEEDAVTVLRPGGVSTDALKEVVGEVHVLGTVEEVAASPGLQSRHYSPVSKTVTANSPPSSIDFVAIVWSDLWRDGDNIIRLPSDVEGYARAFYDALHRADLREPELIVIEPVPKGEPWRAIRDRIARASDSPR